MLIAIVHENVEWIRRAKDKDYWRIVVNLVKIFQVL